MRILLFGDPPVTLRSMQEDLTRRGHKVQIVVPPSGDRPDLVQGAIRTFRPDVIHWFGEVLQQEIPSVVDVAEGDAEMLEGIYRRAING